MFFSNHCSSPLQRQQTAVSLFRFFPTHLMLLENCKSCAENGRCFGNFGNVLVRALNSCCTSLFTTRSWFCSNCLVQTMNYLKWTLPQSVGLQQSSASSTLLQWPRQRASFLCASALLSIKITHSSNFTVEFSAHYHRLCFQFQDTVNDWLVCWLLFSQSVVGGGSGSVLRSTCPQSLEKTFSDEQSSICKFITVTQIHHLS